MPNLFAKLKHRAKKLFRNEFVIPSYDEKRSVIERYRESFRPTTFVETGTFLGETVFYFKDKFDQLYSIELSEELASEANAKFSNINNIEIIQGDSGKVLSSLVPTIEVQALFWLDGHYSSEFYVGDRYVKTAKGEEETPISKEIEVILNARIQHIILIDDARLFTGKGDYPTLKSLKERVSASKFKYSFTVTNDIIQIIPVAI